VKGEISGSETCTFDGSVEGLVQLDDRKLTIGATAKLTPTSSAREVVVYGSVREICVAATASKSRRMVRWLGT